jgi:RNA polymerase subunit RPABC4/transcription elongation factor Spt4
MNFLSEYWIYGVAGAIAVLISFVLTRDERGGAINPDAWKCQACFKNIDSRATICRYCGTSTDRYTQTFGTPMKPPIDTSSVVPKSTSRVNESENIKLISCSKCRLLYSSALTKCPFCQTQT